MSEVRHDTPSTWRHRLWSAATFILLLPLLAMQVTGEVRWGAADFALFSLMLATACVAVEIAFRALPSPTGRIFGCATIALGFAILWAELAVGLVD